MVEIEIGGQLIDRQDENFIKTYLELTEKNPNGCQNSLLQKNLLKADNRNARIPLTFWFVYNREWKGPTCHLCMSKLILKHNTVTFARLSA